MWFEVIVIGLTVVFVYRGIIKKHLQTGQNKIPFWVAISGLALIVGHHMLPMGTLIVTLGGLMVASAHILNMSLSEHKH